MARPNSRRMRQIKQALADRDGAGCFYCGHPFPALITATVDHLIPQSLLPGWALMNLVLACRPCNQRKSGQLPQVFLRAAGRAPAVRRPGRLAVALAALAARVPRVDLPRLAGALGFAAGR
ncbi:HNH endonuclease [Micromonospora sp. DH14]|uniref:HNH endonuclease n=1 Tax=Micromonospora sp. DH14 TaxID=3040120 RepID=UPI002441E6DA|nr:HNH endonuclease [Micromonospora sp. DH14]MDG9678826.1 HNH endonuclease domain-containing protein [Micromonospora sp. DH14]